jgi:hypothetical protein
LRPSGRVLNWKNQRRHSGARSAYTGTLRNSPATSTIPHEIALTFESDAAKDMVGGMSGSPILAEDGSAIGISEAAGKAAPIRVSLTICRQDFSSGHGQAAFTAS